MFQCCEDCKHSGRVHQCRDSAGYYAVSYGALEGFLAGELDNASEGVTFVGVQVVREHRYAEAGEV